MQFFQAPIKNEGSQETSRTPSAETWDRSILNSISWKSYSDMKIVIEFLTWVYLTHIFLNFVWKLNVIRDSNLLEILPMVSLKWVSIDSIVIFVFKNVITFLQALLILPTAWLQMQISECGLQELQDLAHNEGLIMHLNWGIYQIQLDLNFFLKNKIVKFSDMFHLGHTVCKSIWQTTDQGKKQEGRKWLTSLLLLIVLVFAVIANFKSQPSS